jgi:hypothetical protein
VPWPLQMELEFEQQLSSHIQSLQQLASQSLAPLLEQLSALSRLCGRVAGGTAVLEQPGATAGAADAGPTGAAAVEFPEQAAAAAAAAAAPVLALAPHISPPPPPS